jgi:hypothetical protein
MLKTKAVTVSIRFHTHLRDLLLRLCAPTRLLRFSCLLALLAMFVFTGCKRLRHEDHDVVYVSARQVYLHDRVAAVSERVAMVINGQKLEVLERARRFLKVKTEKNEIGWIEERAVIDSDTYERFAKLAEQHKQEPKATTATLRDDLYMHLVPGRQSDRLYLLPENAKVDLLARASAPKSGPGAAGPAAAKSAATAKPAAAPKPAVAGNHAAAGNLAAAGNPAAEEKTAAQVSPNAKSKTAAPGAEQLEAPPPPPMEDWWLARDSQGHVGWLLSSRLDVDVPDEVAQYGENQRFIGCWVLTKVNDPDSSAPDHQVPVYLTMMAPNKSGMPFDFDQVRVFTWSLRHHRYETGFRLRPIQGFLPVRVTMEQTPKGPVPTFSFQIAGNEDVVTDPATGIIRPASPRTITYQLIDTQAKRVGPDMAPIYMMHDPDKKPKAAQKAAKRRRR